MLASTGDVNLQAPLASIIGTAGGSIEMTSNAGSAIFSSTNNEVVISGGLASTVTCATGDTTISTQTATVRLFSPTIEIISNINGILINSAVGTDINSVSNVNVNIAGQPNDMLSITDTTILTDSPTYNANIQPNSLVTKSWVTANTFTPAYVISWLRSANVFTDLTGVSAGQWVSLGTAYWPNDQSGQFLPVIGGNGNGYTYVGAVAAPYVLLLSCEGYANQQDNPCNIGLFHNGGLAYSMKCYSKNTTSFAETSSSYAAHVTLFPGSIVDIRVQYLIDKSPLPNPTAYTISNISLSTTQIIF
jgi:hypothetical protein